MKKRFILIYSLLVLVALSLIGTFLYRALEGWSYVDSFYFTVMTITTVGFGDLVPTHNASKIITAIYSLISIPVVIFIFGIILGKYFETRIKGIESKLGKVESEEKEIEEEIVKK